MAGRKCALASLTGNKPSKDFWNGKKVLITGHTGFKGAWLTKWLTVLGAQVIGVSLNPEEGPSLWNGIARETPIKDIRADIRSNTWKVEVENFKPEICFYLAAQSLVSVGWEQPKETFEINVGGLANFLDWQNKVTSLRTTLVITSDKVYKLDGAHTPRIEDSALGGDDPYSASKAAAELLTLTWPMSNTKIIGTARSGNVIGGGDWAKSRLIPDIVRSWSHGVEFNPRNLDAIRPWQHVLEPLMGYLLMAEALHQDQSNRFTFNFGPKIADQVTVREVIQFTQEWMKSNHVENSGALENLEFRAEQSFKESSVLMLDSSNASNDLGWSPIFSWKEAINLTLNWYLSYANGTAPSKLVTSDIDYFMLHQVTV